MAKTYQISNNIIFCVNEDGPLSEITTLKSEKQKLADAKQSVEVALSNLKGKIGIDLSFNHFRHRNSQCYI